MVHDRLIPDPASIFRRLGSLKTLSRGIENIGRSGNRLAESYNRFGTTVELSKATSKSNRFNAFTSTLQNVLGNIKGSHGQKIDDSIRKFVAEAHASGGAEISSSKLVDLLGELHKSIGKEGATATGADADLLRDLTRSLKDTKKRVTEDGIKGLGEKSLRRATGRIEDNAKLDAARDSIAAQVKKLTATLPVAFQKPLEQIRGNFYRETNTATTIEEKQKAYSNAEAAVKQLKGHSGATSEDKEKLADIADIFKSANTDKAAKGFNAFAGKLQGGLQKVAGALGVTVQALRPLKKSFEYGAQVFNTVNSHFNEFARGQMRISSERGAYGRVMRGAGMDFSSMMSAIGTGRRAGMDDREVVNKMATMQEQLARARWGEGQMIDNLGKWGLTPFDENGDVKDFRRMMIDISNHFNKLGSDSERLQFLHMQGFSPDQMEYVRDYARDAERWEEIKRNPHMQGVLESADILDEDGRQAKIDAYTRIELRRREILNQNAMDEGWFKGMTRRLHPENWLFNDWTARQRGVEAAKSDRAMERLTAELKNAQKAVNQNSQTVKGLQAGMLHLSGEDLANIGLSSGWAEADIANKGDKSSIHRLRQLYAERLGTEDRDSVDSKKNAVADLSLGAGIGLGALGLLGLIAAPFTGGASSAITAAAWGALGVGIAGTVGSHAIRSSKWDDGTMNHVKALRQLKGDYKAIEEYTTKYGLFGLSPEIIESNEFIEDDEAARGRVEGAFVNGKLLDVQKLAGREIDVQKALNYTSDKYWRANERAAIARGEKLAEKRDDEAMARAGSGDESIGMDAETAWNYVNYGLDETSDEFRAKQSVEWGRLRAKYKREGNYKKANDETALKEEATENVRNEFRKTITPEMYQKALEHERELVAQNEVNKNKYEKEWQELGGDYYSQVYDPKELEFAITLNRQNLENARKQKDWRNISFYTRRINLLKSGVKSKEEYVQNMMEKEAEGNVDKIMFKDGKKPFRFLTREEQKKELDRSMNSPFTVKEEEDFRERTRKNQILVRGDVVAARKRAEKELYENGGEEFQKLSRKEKEERINELTKKYTEEDRQEKVRKLGEKLNKTEWTEEEIAEEQAKVKGDAVEARKQAEKDFANDETFQGLTKEEQEKIISERAQTYEEADRQKKAEELGQRLRRFSRTSKLSYGARLARIARDQGISVNEARNLLFEEDEVDKIEKQIENGEELDAETKEKYEQYKKGSKYKERQRKKAAEAKKAEEEAKRKAEETEIDDELARRFGGGDKPAGEVALPKKEEGLSPKMLKLIRTAKARRPDDWTKGFKAEEIEAFKKYEEEEKKRFVEKGLGTEEEYEEYKDLEELKLKGEQLSERDEADYEKKRKALEKPVRKARQKKQYTEKEEKARAEAKRARERVAAKSKKIAEERAAEKAQAAKQRSITREVTFRQIDQMREKGMSDEDIEKTVGTTALEQFKEAVAAGEYEDQATKRAKLDRAAYEEKIVSELAQSGLSPEQAKDAIIQKMMEYDERVAKEKAAKAKRPAAVGAPSAEVRGMQESAEAVEEKVEGVQEATAVMREKEAGVAQASQKLETAGMAAETAAASARSATAGEAMRQGGNVTVNFGGQNITQNIQGEYPMDKDGMKSGTMQGASDIRDKTAEAFISVLDSKGSY